MSRGARAPVPHSWRRQCQRYILRQRLLTFCPSVEQHVIDASTDQWRARLIACIQGGPKIWHSVLYALTLPNIN